MKSPAARRNEQKHFLVLLNSFDVARYEFIEVRWGEKFIIPDSCRYGWTVINEQAYKLSPGKRYSIGMDGLLCEYLPNEIELLYRFYEARNKDDDFAYVRFSVEKYNRNEAIVVGTNGAMRLWGYANVQGDIIIHAIYDDATDLNFRDIGAVKKNHRWFFIHVGGERIDGEYYDRLDGPYLDTGYFSYAKRDWGDGRGLIDPSGRIVLMPHYDTMPIPLSNQTYHVCKNGRSGLLDQGGEVVVPFGEYNVSVK